MTHKKIYEVHRTLDRAELAHQLRGLADELDTGGVITYDSDGTAGALALPDELRSELVITHGKNDDHIKLVARLRFTENDGAGAEDADADSADDADWEADDPYA
ncbi:amphi-Trp domain-containing protein [Nocardia sp. NPDC046763]|uniref:amphi-Trp domain-containing protein n=1 Tax=Nocardia sp. NPDC046763 TaxID=3155256 RepID=UPI0034111222